MIITPIGDAFACHHHRHESPPETCEVSHSDRRPLASCLLIAMTEKLHLVHIEPVLTENDPIQLNRKPSPACSVLSHPHLLGWQITFYLPPNTGYIHTLEDGMHAVRYD